jgi:hypothetical protein
MSDLEIYIRFCIHLYFEEYDYIILTIQAHKPLFINPSPICNKILNLLEEKWYWKSLEGINRYIV